MNDFVASRGRSGSKGNKVFKDLTVEIGQGITEFMPHESTDCFGRK